MKRIVLLVGLLVGLGCYAQTPPTFEELIGLHRTPTLQVVRGPSTPPTVMLEQSIDDDAASAFEASLDLLAKDRPKVIRVIINSDGGSVDATFRIAQLVERYPAKVECIVDVRAQSGASAILQSCDRRTMTRRSFIMMHRPLMTCERCDEQKLREAADTMSVIANQLAEQSCRRSKVKASDWLQRTVSGEWTLGPDEALRLGFIDEIVSKVVW